MAKDPDPDIPVSVTTGEVRVGKAFEPDRFPVPAIAFEIESLADEPIRIRLIDDIPESFPMEGVGFHPDYEGDNWTAYRDNRVAYERTIEPGESVLTVYGIRIDDPEEAEDFLDDPEIELIEHGEAAATGDVLGRETTQVVRDALSGDDSSSIEDIGSGALLDDDGAPAPRDRVDDPVTVTDDRDESVTTVEVADTEADDETEPDETTDEESEDADDAVPSSAAAEALDPRSGDDDAAEVVDDESAGAGEPSTPAPAAESVAATLAAEIRAGVVDDDDLAVLREAFEGEVPTSVDVRIERLQSQIEDLVAYRDALADFLDENGTAEEVVGELSEDLHELTDRVDALESTLAEADENRATLHEEVSAVTDRVDDAADRIDGVATDLDDLDATAKTLEERLESVEELESDIESIEDELEDLRDFRDRLSSAFGTEE